MFVPQERAIKLKIKEIGEDDVGRYSWKISFRINIYRRYPKRIDSFNHL